MAVKRPSVRGSFGGSALFSRACLVYGSPAHALIGGSRGEEPQLYTRAFWLAALAHFLFLTGFWMFVLLPPHLANLGAGETRIGVDSLAMLSVSGLLCGMGHGYLFPILSGLAVEHTDSGSRGNAMSLFTAMFDLGQMMGPALFGLLAESPGYPRMFMIASMIVFANLILWIPDTLRRTAHA